jgi:hypothetical protein
LYAVYRLGAVRINIAILTFSKGFFEAFPVDMFEDVVRLPVEVP